MKRDRWEMVFFDSAGCWIACSDDDREYWMRCGDEFILHLGGRQRIPCRLELGMEWYILAGKQGIRLNLNENEIYKVEI